MPTLERAVALWRAGDAHQAEFICQSLAHAGGRGASGALGLLAEIYASTGRPERAIASLHWARDRIRSGKQVLFRDRQAIQGLEAFLEQITLRQIAAQPAGDVCTDG